MFLIDSLRSSSLNNITFTPIQIESFIAENKINVTQKMTQETFWE